MYESMLECIHSGAGLGSAERERERQRDGDREGGREKECLSVVHMCTCACSVKS